MMMLAPDRNNMMKSQIDDSIDSFLLTNHRTFLVKIMIVLEKFMQGI